MVAPDIGAVAAQPPPMPKNSTMTASPSQNVLRNSDFSGGTSIGGRVAVGGRYRSGVVFAAISRFVPVMPMSSLDGRP